MIHSAAIILGLSLIVTGLAIIGDALGWWTIPGDIWSAVVVLIATSARWVQTRLSSSDPIEPEPDSSNGEKIKASTKVLLILFCSFLSACSSPQLKSDALHWAKCAGLGALHCIPAAGNSDSTKAAIDYTACIAQRSIECVGPYVARANPPDPKEVHPIRNAISLECVEDAAASCVIVARSDSGSAVKKDSQSCIEGKIASCFKQ